MASPCSGAIFLHLAGPCNFLIKEVVGKCNEFCLLNLVSVKLVWGKILHYKIIYQKIFFIIL